MFNCDLPVTDAKNWCASGPRLHDHPRLRSSLLQTMWMTRRSHLWIRTSNISRQGIYSRWLSHQAQTEMNEPIISSEEITKQDDAELFVCCDCEECSYPSRCDCQRPSELADKNERKMFAYTEDVSIAFYPMLCCP